MGWVADTPKLQQARLRFQCDGHGSLMHAIVTPDGGGTEYYLPLIDADVECEAGGAITATVKLFTGPLSLRDVSTGQRLTAKPPPQRPAVYPDVSFEPEQKLCRAFRYRTRVGSLATLELDLVNLDRPWYTSPLRLLRRLLP